MASRPKILIIDDETRNINILIEILNNDYDLAFSLNGTEGIKLVESFKPDIILLDIMLPDESGYDICTFIRAQYGHSSKIILVSGKNQIQDRVQGYDAGADDYITRPFSGDELCAKLRVYLQLKHAEEWGATQQGVLQHCCEIISTPTEGVLAQTKMLLANKCLNRPAKLIVKDIALKVAAMADKINELSEDAPVLSLLEDEVVEEIEMIVEPGDDEEIDESENESVKELKPLESLADASVLLVDDSSVMRIIQRKILSNIGFKNIDEAENGRQAIMQLEKKDYSYNLMFCDMNMPVLHGLEVLEAIRQSKNGKQLPVIMCSSVAYSEDVSRAFDLGASGYITKPFRPADIVAKLSEIGLCSIVGH